MIARLGLTLFMGLIPGKVLKRLGVHFGVPDVRWSLTLLQRFGFNPENVMDAGAFEGKWTRTCLEVFPQAAITCIEPQSALQEKLQNLQAKHPNVGVIQTLLGGHDTEGVLFKEMGSGSSLYLDSEGGVSIPMATIDHLVESGRCKPPELLKLDVQGYEIEVLEGYTRYFDACQVIQCEIGLLPLVPDAPLLRETVDYLHRRGFVMFDIEELIRGPSDGTVWQIDALFCRVDSPLRLNRVW